MGITQQPPVIVAVLAQAKCHGVVGIELDVYPGFAARQALRIDAKEILGPLRRQLAGLGHRLIAAGLTLLGVQTGQAQAFHFALYFRLDGVAVYHFCEFDLLDARAGHGFSLVVGCGGIQRRTITG